MYASKVGADDVKIITSDEDVKLEQILQGSDPKRYEPEIHDLKKVAKDLKISILSKNSVSSEASMSFNNAL